MKPFIKVLILVFVCILVLLMGCSKKDYSQYKEPGFNQDIIKVKSLNVEQQTTFTEFKDEMEEFKSFSDEFFPIWSEHINKTSSTLDDFNSSTILEEKFICSDALEKRYSEFLSQLENIKAPAITKKAYELALESVSYRILFFKKFNQNAPVNELSKLEGMAYIAEAGFWDEINNLYRYFDEGMARLHTSDDDKYIVFN